MRAYSQFVKRSLGLVLLCSLAMPAFGQRCVPEVFCIDTEQDGAFIDLYVDNLSPGEVSLALDISVNGGKVNTDRPLLATYPPHQRTWVLRLEPEPGKQMYFRYETRWTHGSMIARHDDSYAYALPYAPGKTYHVTQGFDGPNTHQGRHALDFDLPERTPVHAAREGVVVDVEDRYTEGGLEPRLRDRSNFVLIRHEDGTLGYYGHLVPNGVFVRVGQRVRQGQAIAVSGSTGYSGGPHLHFEVYTLNNQMQTVTVPFRFRVGERHVARLEAGHAYRAPLK